jgi:phosphohistidine phosphatase
MSAAASAPAHPARAAGAAPIHVLIRHAEASAHPVDARRPLSARGREQAVRLGRLLAVEARFGPAEIWHSPLVRARETAARLVAAVGFAGPVRERPSLEPEDDPGVAAEWLRAEARGIAVVGHEPHLAALVTGLAGWDARALGAGFAKAGALALWREGARWRAEWLVQSP